MINLTTNRAFLYGDGVFESILVKQGIAPFLDYHRTRLRKSLLHLGIKEPFPLDDNHHLWLHIQNLIKNEPLSTYRVRLSVWRESAGLYAPRENRSDFLFQSQILDLGTQKLFLDKVAICPSIRLAYDDFSAIKSLSAARYVAAARFKEANGLDDCFLLNASERIAEASSANVFVVLQDDTVLSPALSEGCIAGVMRQVILEKLPLMSYRLQEGEVSIECLSQAKEIFLSNAISGIRSILFYNGRKLDSSIANKLRELF